MSAIENCKHIHGFRFLACSAADRLPGLWVCKFECGYTTRTNPENPYPKGIRYTEVNQGTKTLPELKSSRSG